MRTGTTMYSPIGYDRGYMVWLLFGNWLTNGRADRADMGCGRLEETNLDHQQDLGVSAQAGMLARRAPLKRNRATARFHPRL